MEQLTGLFHEHADLAVVELHLSRLLAGVERGERRVRIGGMRGLVFLFKANLGTPNHRRAAQAGEQNHDAEPVERETELGNRD